MIRGLYTSASGLVAADARQQVLAAHVANADTPGYKTDDVTNESFEQVLAALFDPTQPGTGVQSAGRTFDLSQGGITQTGAPLDLALDGPGFFVLDGPAGPLYTRAGRFSRDAQGVLRSPDGHTVQGVDGGAIVAPGANVAVRPDGTVLSDGVAVGRVRVVTLDAAQLTRAGTATFMSAAAPAEATEARVVGGALERSNVDVTAVMTSMTMLVRAFEIGKQALQMQNEVLGVGVNQVGSLR
jgi:flagellar basal-body rod protein FlgG